MRRKVLSWAIGGLAAVAATGGAFAVASSNEASTKADTSANVVTTIQSAAQQRQQNPLGYEDSRLGVEFPVGTTYAEALHAIHLVEKTGDVVMPMTVVQDMPQRAVVVQPVRASERLQVRLAAPVGYDHEFGSHVVLRVVPNPEAPLSAHGMWQVGSSVAVPILPDCMIVRGEGDAGAPCGPSDIPVYSDDSPRGPVLP